MASGFCMASIGSGGAGYYLREGECIDFKHSNQMLGSRDLIMKDWDRIARDEINGNKELGIRGRHDAQVRKTYMFTVPNELTPKESIERIDNLIQKTPIKDCTYTICFHRGERDGIDNKHIHVMVNERNLKTMKKDRTMVKPEFLAKEIKPLYQEAFAKEFMLAPQIKGQRERIHMALYKSDESYARQEINAQKEIVPSVSASLSDAQLNAWYKDFLQDDYPALVREEERKAKEVERLAAEKLERELEQKNELAKQQKLQEKDLAEKNKSKGITR